MTEMYLKQISQPKIIADFTWLIAGSQAPDPMSSGGPSGGGGGRGAVAGRVASLHPWVVLAQEACLQSLSGKSHPKFNM